MKQLLAKILILLMLFSLSVELSSHFFNTDTSQYVITDIDESDKKEKDDVEKDKIPALYPLNFLSFKKEVVAGFLISYTSAAFKFLPEIPPEQA